MRPRRLNDDFLEPGTIEQPRLVRKQVVVVYMNMLMKLLCRFSLLLWELAVLSSVILSRSFSYCHLDDAGSYLVFTCVLRYNFESRFDIYRLGITRHTFSLERL